MAKYNFGNGWLYVNGIPMNAGSDLFGIGAGEIFYLFNSTTSNEYYKRLSKNGVKSDHIFTDLTLAHAAMTSDRNDVLCVFPGAHAVTAEVAWSKNHCHMVGLGGPTSFNDYSEANVSIYTITAGVSHTVTLTGNHCQFHGINFTNYAADVLNLASFNVDGYDSLFKGCSFHGAMNTTQCIPANAALYIDDGGSQYKFENCEIGEPNWFTRDSAQSGQLAYIGTAGVYSGNFTNCKFQVSSETAAVALVRLAETACIARDHTFDRCVFVNQSVNWGNMLTQVFTVVGGPQTCQIILKDSLCVGFTQWQTNDTGWAFVTNSPVATDDGGIVIEASGT